MCSYAPGISLLDLLCFVTVVTLDLVKICNFQIVLHVAQKIFDLRSWNFTGMLLSMWNCAPGVSLVDLFCFVKVIALALVKTCNFQLLLHEAQNFFYPGSCNFTGMLICMCSCAPGYFCVDLFSIRRVIVLVLLKNCNFQLVLHIPQKLFD
jgi:hypothetical protein